MPVLLTSQKREGVHVGSFDPVGPWGPNGGRIYSTAIMTLVAEMAESAALVEKAGK